MYPLYNHFPISIYPLCNQILCPAKMRWRDGAKSAVSAGQDSPRQPEIAPQFCRREILVGNPLPTPSETCLQPVGSLRSQHGFAEGGKTNEHAYSLPLPPVISAARFASVCRRIAAVCPSLSRRRFGYNQAIKAKEADFP